MLERLLNKLTLEQVADLFALLMNKPGVGTDGAAAFNTTVRTVKLCRLF